MAYAFSKASWYRTANLRSRSRRQVVKPRQGEKPAAPTKLAVTSRQSCKVMLGFSGRRLRGLRFKVWVLWVLGFGAQGLAFTALAFRLGVRALYSRCLKKHRNRSSCQGVVMVPMGAEGTREGDLLRLVGLGLLTSCS